MISHIHSVTVVVADQRAALDFYVNTLGWQKAMDVPMGESGNWITVVPPGQITQLALAPDVWFNDDDRPGKGGIALSTPDIDATYETLTSRGVKFKAPPAVMPWGGKATTFYDLDGNEFFLAGE